MKRKVRVTSKGQLLTVKRWKHNKKNQVAFPYPENKACSLYLCETREPKGGEGRTPIEPLFSLSDVYIKVSVVYDRGQLLLKAECDGIVYITKEKVDLKMDNELVHRNYSDRNVEGLEKLHFNVVQKRMSQKFKLVSEV
ncbi:unnamed protein product [Bursaphelenchus okinawaensis]|uniref:Uncharacterized protein n=1 Tax=Bursaphelenchus okinawaensis TaxID=465554 RepID=A0A811K8X1_9BILA|nr:unnamed protein product [Bursaphelenchus okinawaensis]CAG9094498.1 unnamed protein product [Bursaphelenchus okinawaensis]